MSADIRATLPSIIISDSEATRLGNLASRMETAEPQAAGLLLNEISRAQIRPDTEVPDNVVRMNCRVTYVDDRHAKMKTVRVVYPGDADITYDKISILTPVGAALIGLTVGQTMTWVDRDGHQRSLRVLRVSQPDHADHSPDGPAAA